MKPLGRKLTAQERTQASRDRMLVGSLLVSIELTAADLDRLVGEGRLLDAQRRDKEAVAQALLTKLRAPKPHVAKADAAPPSSQAGPAAPVAESSPKPIPAPPMPLPNPATIAPGIRRRQIMRLRYPA